MKIKFDQWSVDIFKRAFDFKYDTIDYDYLFLFF
jgi:hypothetical protein